MLFCMDSEVSKLPLLYQELHSCNSGKDGV